MTFSYTVASGQNTSALAVTAVNGIVTDLDGNALSTSFAGVVVGSDGSTGSSSSGPTLTSPSTGASTPGIYRHPDAQPERGGDGCGRGGTPRLTLNDGGTVTYTGGSGTSALTFSYTVAAGPRHHWQQRRSTSTAPQCRIVPATPRAFH